MRLNNERLKNRLALFYLRDRRDQRTQNGPTIRNRPGAPSNSRSRAEFEVFERSLDQDDVRRFPDSPDNVIGGWKDAVPNNIHNYPN